MLNSTESSNSGSLPPTTMETGLSWRSRSSLAYTGHSSGLRSFCAKLAPSSSPTYACARAGSSLAAQQLGLAARISGVVHHAHTHTGWDQRISHVHKARRAGRGTQIQRRVHQHSLVGCPPSAQPTKRGLRGVMGRATCKAVMQFVVVWASLYVVALPPWHNAA